MPDPGSHSYDVKRTRLRAEYDDRGVPDGHADDAANAELERDHPPVPLGDPDRAAGPRGTGGDSRGDPDVGDPVPAPGGVVLRSPAFSDHTLIPDVHARDGGNAAPPLEWLQAPAETAEFALVCEDPDAPSGTFVHWVVAGIPAEATGISGDGLPGGAVAGRNDFGDLGWGGPQPPVGDEPHRYFFRLYALDRTLGLSEGVGADELRAAVAGHELARGTLVGRFGR